MFVDELRVAVPAQQDAEIIEPGHDSLKLHAVHEEDGQRRLVLSDIIEKSVLEAWCSIGGHVFSVFVDAAGYPAQLLVMIFGIVQTISAIFVIFCPCGYIVGDPRLPEASCRHFNNAAPDELSA
jgi:hypothetical protein